MASIVSSFGFEPVGLSTMVHGVLDYWVLWPPSQYPVGSVTRKEMPSSSYGSPYPFYLIHVREGFTRWRGRPTWAAAISTVTCARPLEQGVLLPQWSRWALDGSVVAKPGPRYPADRLEVLLVRFSLDGYVMVSPNVGMQDTSTDLRLT